MAELSKAVQGAIQALGERLRAGPRTLNELHDWWVKEQNGDAGDLKTGIRELLRLELVEARNLGKAKMLALAGQHHQPLPKGSPIVKRDAKPANTPADERPRTWTPGVKPESTGARHERLERAAAKPFTVEALAKAKLGREIVEHEVSTAAAAPPPLAPPARPRPSTPAPSPAAADAAMLNVRAVERTRDNDALSAPPAPEPPRGNATPSASAGGTPAASTHSTMGFSRSYNQERFLPPPPDPDGTEWVNMHDAAAMLGLKSSASMEYVRKSYGWVRRKQKVEKPKQPYFYARADLAKLIEHRRGNALVHSQRPPRGNAPADQRATVVLRAAPTGSAEAAVRTLATAAGQAAAVAEGARRWREKDLGPDVERYLHLEVSPQARRLLEDLLETGLYGADVHEVAERLLLEELRRHVDMPRLTLAARGQR